MNRVQKWIEQQVTKREQKLNEQAVDSAFKDLANESFSLDGPGPVLAKDKVQNIEGITKALPGIKVFVMPRDANALANFLIERRNAANAAREHGDGTAQEQEE